MNDDFKTRQREREIREKAIEYLMEIFTRNAQDPERIGRRVLYMQFILDREKGFPSMKELAAKLRVTPSAASQGVAAMLEDLEALRNLNDPLRENEKNAQQTGITPASRSNI